MLLKAMSELSAYLASLSFGEFIVIWVLTILTVFFPVLLLYILIRMRKDIKLLVINIDRILDLLVDAEKINQHEKKNPVEILGNKLNIKTKIINLLEKSNRPMPYSEIARKFSNDSVDYDFESILSIIEQLKSEEKIVDRVSGGKLYFRINK